MKRPTGRVFCSWSTASIQATLACAERRVTSSKSWVVLDAAEMDWVFKKDHGASCLVGSVVRYVALAGYGNDERLEPLVQRLVRDSKKFDAACWINGELPCAWGYARLIWGLAALPETARSREVQRTLRRGVEFLLSYRVERGRYPTDTVPSYLWRQLSFPLFYQADILFVLRTLDAGERSTMTEHSPLSAGSSRDRTNAGVGADGRRTRLVCHREWTRASGSRCRPARS